MPPISTSFCCCWGCCIIIASSSSAASGLTGSTGSAASRGERLFNGSIIWKFASNVGKSCSIVVDVVVVLEGKEGKIELEGVSKDRDAKCVFWLSSGGGDGVCKGMENALAECCRPPAGDASGIRGHVRSGVGHRKQMPAAHRVNVRSGLRLNLQ